MEEGKSSTRKSFSDDDSDEQDEIPEESEEIVIPRSLKRKLKAGPPKAKRPKPDPSSGFQKAGVVHDSYQQIAEKAPPGFAGCARNSSWQAFKSLQAK